MEIKTEITEGVPVRTKRIINYGPLNRRQTVLIQHKYKDEFDYAFEFSGVITSGADIDELRRFKALLNSFKEI
ncbi:hypothetical protein KNT81_gp222 [Proteus phage phiP4-3]|uniref:Uncharacterized protein n=1 Tax=Proteus phage phiP4-3 TaxID=2065203 RepID=A0A2I6PFN4_9CAUD|nr:hypothetical protein KNT81_gp222 [Proteus phage phiP4-3]AUM58549.1 hypothetical protein phiP43_191 [Proteus phage phiP4-3]AZV01210.1 hypothetical protein vBSdyM006_073 [Shigella phage vB_SdyM_006]